MDAVMQSIVTDMDRFVAKETVALLFEVSATIIEDTPLDLGWARANFVPNIARPFRTNLTLDAPPTSGAAAAQASDTQRRLFAIASEYRAEMGPLYLSNNVPYIGALNAGHSPQAPAGYFQASIVTAVAKKRGA